MELETADENRMIDAVQLAAQDAVQDVTPSTLASGQAVFDQLEADATFRSTLAANLDLNASTLEPNPNTMLKVAPQILVEKFIDYSNSTFPTTYTNSTYHINYTSSYPITNPSIVLVVQFTMPSYTGDVTPFAIDVPVVQSYQYSS